MAKLIGVSGPQGCGKTTILNGLAEAGFAVDNFKVSRSVQKEFGAESLSEIISDPFEMIRFQNRIIERKRERELENKERTDSKLIFTERTFADISSYAQLWCYDLLTEDKLDIPEAVKFLLDMSAKCFENQKLYDGIIFLPYMDHIPWQPDPYRAAYNDINAFNNQLEAFFEMRTTPLLKITERTVESRVQEIKDWVKEKLGT